MPQPLWDSDGLLRRDALWRDADQVLTTRAMTRCALAAGWIALAALAIPGYAWAGGMPVLLGSGLALLHASHTLVVGMSACPACSGGCSSASSSTRTSRTSTGSE